MNRDTRNETIRALAAASAAAIRMAPERALRAHAAVAGEIRLDDDELTIPTPGAIKRGTDRPMPIEPTPNRYTGEIRGAR